MSGFLGTWKNSFDLRHLVDWKKVEPILETFHSSMCIFTLHFCNTMTMLNWGKTLRPHHSVPYCPFGFSKKIFLVILSAIQPSYLFSLQMFQTLRSFAARWKNAQWIEKKLRSLRGNGSTNVMVGKMFLQVWKFSSVKGVCQEKEKMSSDAFLLHPCFRASCIIYIIL